MLDGTSLAWGGLTMVFAVAALALLERLAKVGFARAPKLAPDPAPLRIAAESAYDYAREKRLPLAAIAERKSGPGDAVDWFENHMLRAVPVTATSLKTGAVKALGSLARAKMYAVPSGIAKTAGGDAAYSDPVVSAKDFKAYLRWVRTVW
jgi:hypothetical protein